MFKNRFVNRFWYSWFLLGFWLFVACQPIAVEQSTQQAVTVSPAPQTMTEISTPTITVTPLTSPGTFTPTTAIQLTAMIEQPSTIVPTVVASPWQLERSGEFLIFEGAFLDEDNNQLEAIYYSQPGAVSTFLSEGQLITGESLSPDGTKLIFDQDGSTLSYQLRPNQLWLANLETGEITLLQLLKRPTRIFWTIDSHSFLYTLGVGEESLQLVSYNITTQENVVLTQFQKTANETWLTSGLSYDGRLFAFIIETNGQYDVYTLDLETLLLRQVTNTPEVEVEAIWSPVERQLLVRVNQQGERWAFNHPPYISQTLLVIDETGQNVIPLGDDFEATRATWSSDGQEIAYVDRETLCFMGIVAQEERCPLQGTIFNEQYTNTGTAPLAWSLNNRWVAFYGIPKEGYPCPQLFFLDMLTETVVESEEPTCGARVIYWSK